FTNTTGGAATFNLLFAKFSGGNPGFLKYINFRTNMGSLQFATNSGTSFGHPNAAGAEAVGAAFFGQTPAFGVSPPVLESFSSAGGPQIRLNTAGSPITPVTRNTPDITAPDGGNTTFFGQDIGFDTDTFPNFFGTSAAAPHAAAVAALMRQANPSATPAQIYSALETTPINMGPAGHASDPGFGLTAARAAIRSLVVPAITLPGGAVTYTALAPPVVLDSGATFSDSLVADLNPGTLTVDFTANGAATDVLSIRN